ncbi:MAG: TauD/TfdA family dioxygenase [Novosphingobium sp.]|nr:TauD/TfdA family dioxygenase [Novosphingobium sp.]MCP5403144.1 TauD/TfdA family dioxygenase [Novosphingobium sp.]
MTLKITPLRDELSFGARIYGVTEEALEDPGARDDILQAFEERGLIVFADVEPVNRLQVALSGIFGPLKEHPVDAVDLVDPDFMLGAIRIDSDPSYADLVEIDGKPYSSWLPWHFDHCYNNELNRAGVLRAVEITPNGGQTCFFDGIELYRQLAPELRERIEGCSVLYSLDMQPDHIRFGRPANFRVLQVDPKQLEILEQAKVFPRAIHPAVWTRDSGEKVLHLSPWMAEGIEGRENAEGDALLEEVAREIIRIAEAGAYVHDWEPTDMLIWDNWRMLHRVTGCTPPHPRSIYRTTIKGDYGLGRFENDVQGRYRELERTV